MNYGRMAWRNVWRNKRRTAITVGAMSFALLVGILYSSLINGYFATMQESILEFMVGDIQVFQLGYRDDPSFYSRIEAPERLLAELERAGFRAAARCTAAGLAAVGETSGGVLLHGVDPVRDATVSRLYEKVRQGAWLDPAEPSGVVIGGGLSRTLGAGLGEEMVLLTQAADGSLANDLFRVRGVLGGVAEEVDRAGVFMLEPTFRELMVMPEGVHQIVVRHPKGMALDEARAAVAAIVPGLDVKTWRELLPTVASMLEQARGFVYLFFAIIYVAVGILILNTMLMAVFERVRELGILKALGFSPLGVLRLILLEGGIQMLLSVALANVLAGPLLWLLVTRGISLGGGDGSVEMMGMNLELTMRGIVTAQVFVAPVLIMILMTCVALAYPAFRAARVDPVEAMHHR